MIREISFLLNLASAPVLKKAVVKGHLAIFPDADIYRIIHTASGLGICTFYCRDLAVNCFMTLARLEWSGDVYSTPKNTVKAMRETIEDFAEVEKW